MNENDLVAKKEKRIQELTRKSIPELQQILERETKEQLVRLIADLEENIRGIVISDLRRILGTALGFDCTWSRWELKQDSPITRALGELALAHIKIALPDFIENIHSDAVIEEKMTDALTRDYGYRLQRKIAEQLEQWVQAEATKRSGAAIAALQLENKT